MVVRAICFRRPAPDGRTRGAGVLRGGDASGLDAPVACRVTATTMPLPAARPKGAFRTVHEFFTVVSSSPRRIRPAVRASS